MKSDPGNQFPLMTGKDLYSALFIFKGKRRRLISGFIFLFLFMISPRVFGQQEELQGDVRDFDNKEPIKGATLLIKKTTRSTISNEQGKFSILLPVNSYEITCTAIGFQSSTKMAYLLDSRYILFELKKQPPTELSEVVVESRRKDANVADGRMSTVNINVAQLRKVPMVFGEADIIRALTLQAGITTVGEGASGYNVRGGSVDQNLMLLDGAPIFNVSHLLGFYSAISSDAVQSLNLYKGSIPASYGGRLSSLASISMKTGNEQHIRFNTGVGPVSAHVFADGPLSEKLTFLAGFRVAYPKMMLSAFPGKVGNSNAFFYDGTMKLSYHVNQNNRVTLSLYRSYDEYKFQGDTAYAWGSNMASLNWRSDLSKKVFFRLNANSSYFRSDINGSEPDYQFQLRNSILHRQVKGSFGIQLWEGNNLEAGSDFVNYGINPGLLKPASSGSSIKNIALQTEHGNEISLFALDRMEVNDFISFELGIRHSSFSYRGPHTIYEYAEGKPRSQLTITDSISYDKGKTIKTYDGWEPRLSLKIGLGKKTSLKFSYDKSYQYLQLISNTIAITPVDYWKLSDVQIKPALGNQFAAGLFRNFKDDVFETSIEGFYKTTEHLLDYKNGAFLSMNPYLDADLLEAQGRSYGLEVNVRKTKGKIYGQFAYTWSRSFIRDVTSFAVERVNGGEYYPSNYDRPSNLSITGGFRFGHGWDLNSNFVYVSGRPATYPAATYVINNTVVTDYTLRNGGRLSSYNRLDISFSHDSRRFPDQKRYTILNFSVYNVYARKNPYSIFFQRDGNMLNAYQLSILGTIVPSVTLYYFF